MTESFDFVKYEQIEYMKIDMRQFFAAMIKKMIEKYDEKELSYKDGNIPYLTTELKHHVHKKDWIDVANFCFMLWYNQMYGIIK